MEELLIVIIQFIFEFTLNILGNIPFDWSSRNRTTPEPDSIVFPCFLWFCGGCALAGISLLIARHSLITLPALRIVNLVIAPVTSAFISRAIARHRAINNPFIIPNNHFWQAFSFTLGLVIIRFAYASRA
jgi:hypothetical protein